MLFICVCIYIIYIYVIYMCMYIYICVYIYIKSRPSTSLIKITDFQIIKMSKNVYFYECYHILQILRVHNFHLKYTKAWISCTLKTREIFKNFLSVYHFVTMSIVSAFLCVLSWFHIFLNILVLKIKYMPNTKKTEKR